MTDFWLPPLTPCVTTCVTFYRYSSYLLQISGARYRCTNSPPRHHENREEGKAKRETTVCYPGLLEDQPPVVPTGKHILYLNAFLPTTASRPGSPPRGQLVHRSPPFGGQAG
eukprot:Sspe_Gene.43184::Locus_21010_Transcript_2_3_Confidence_0.714_Length_398::g.43184::m.43184